MNFGGANLGPTTLNQVQNEVFCDFLEFEWYVCLEIAYNDSLLQCLTTSGNKIHEKGPNFGQTGLNQAQNEDFRHFLEFSLK